MKKTIFIAVALGCFVLPASVMALPTQLTDTQILALDTDGDDSTNGFGTQISYDVDNNGVDENIFNYGNNPTSLALVEDIVQAYFGSQCTVEEYDRVEETDGSDATYISPNIEAVGYNGTGSTDEDIFLSSTYGGWGVIDPLNSTGIDVWMVKASQEFTLWTYGETSMNGYWTTAGLTNAHLKLHEISHFTAYINDCGGENAPIPEPATMLLFGTGLVSLVGFSRKKKK